MNPFISKYQAKKIAKAQEKRWHETGTRTEGVHTPEPERGPVHALDEKECGKATSRERIVVSVTRCSTRSLDEDNLYGSCKAVIDHLRYSGLIPEDSQEAISLTCHQEPVRTRKEHSTKIKITYPE